MVAGGNGKDPSVTLDLSQRLSWRLWFHHVPSASCISWCFDNHFGCRNLFLIGSISCVTRTATNYLAGKLRIQHKEPGTCLVPAWGLWYATGLVKWKHLSYLIMVSVQPCCEYQKRHNFFSVTHVNTVQYINSHWSFQFGVPGFEFWEIYQSILKKEPWLGPHICEKTVLFQVSPPVVNCLKYN